MNRSLVPAFFLTVSACTTMAPTRRAERLAGEARTLRAEHRNEAAYARYAQAVRIDPSNGAAMRGWLEVAERLGRLPEVESFYARRTLDFPNAASAHVGLGLAVAAQGDQRLGESRRSLERACALAPDDADAAFRLGLVTAKAGDWEAARTALARAAMLEPKVARRQVALARAQAETGHPAEAARGLAAMLGLSPDREDLEQARGVSRLLDRRYRALPEDSSRRMRKVLELIELDEVTRAREELALLEAAHPDAAVVAAAEGLRARKANDGAQAVTALRRAMSLAPDAAEPPLLLADLYAARGRQNEARPLYEQALAADPMLADARKRLAELETAADDRPRALEHWATYALVAPGDLPARLAYVTLVEQTAGQDATVVWDGLAADFPASPEVLVGRARWQYGKALATRGTDRTQAVRRARTDLETLLSFDPDNKAAPALLAALDRL
jgi:tetratricopeptide (TPR) repeat protein